MKYSYIFIFSYYNIIEYIQNIDIENEYKKDIYFYMKSIKDRTLKTTQHIADKILMLRRANKLTQEKFAEKVGLDRRTVARAEEGKHKPSAETLEMIALTFDIPISYFYDNSTFKIDISKTALIYNINQKLNVLSKNNLEKIIKLIDILN